jgi:hypothetical protein
MQPRTGTSRLPASRAFVIHLLDEADPARGAYPGRVEHVTSGESRSFDDVAALLAFFHDILAAGTPASSATPDKPHR